MAWRCVVSPFDSSAPDSLIDLRTGAFTIHSVDRVQNLSLWKTYAAKRAATCSREDDPEKARRRLQCRNPNYAIDVTARLPRR